MKKLIVFLMMLGLVAAFAAPVVVQAGQYDITTLPGYQVVTTDPLNFSDGGWAGWSITGKVVLGAKIISAGDSISDFSVFKPVGPGTVTPFNYTYGANEYGFLFQDVQNSAGNPGVKIELYFADPMAGYTITKSDTLYYNATGKGGWSAPFGNVVSGGGFQFSNGGASASVSQFLEYPSNFTGGYAYSPGEEGWGVQSAQVGGQANIYLISFDKPASVPEPASMLLLGLGLLGLAGIRRKFKG